MANEEWTDEELRASIEAYLEMRRLFRAGEKFVKKDFYRDLASRFERTEKSFEFRFQNISHVLALLGRDWVPGLVPAAHVGEGVVSRIETILAEIEGVSPVGKAQFEARVRAVRGKKITESPKPDGVKSPEISSGTQSSFLRDPAVKAWVLEEAKGKCECCRQPAPFMTHDEIPFLEVHHVLRLADGGSDTVENAVALCPNCHRALHYASDRQKIRDNLYSQVERIERE